ncbi:hypothetical protein MNBD_BACTEROID07-1474 [hydrothermal vent metagenome]|uniref:Uncharacterized protein n=1 Tax=hydrothermal vent metagenome TaxID=652676 RepID=A0A3B0VCJ9_9ZZZZ
MVQRNFIPTSVRNAFAKIYSQSIVNFLHLLLSSNETTDSVMVIFDNTHSIMHYKNENSGASRSILNLDNWEKLEKQKYYYKYEYKFNENDYNEASQTAHNNGS